MLWMVGLGLTRHFHGDLPSLKYLKGLTKGSTRSVRAGNVRLRTSPDSPFKSITLANATSSETKFDKSTHKEARRTQWSPFLFRGMQRKLHCFALVSMTALQWLHKAHGNRESVPTGVEVIKPYQRVGHIFMGRLFHVPLHLQSYSVFVATTAIPDMKNRKIFTISWAVFYFMQFDNWK